MDTNQSKTIQVIQHLRLSPEKVFNSWINPEMISQWMFGPHIREEEIVHLQADPQVGGRFSFLVRRQGKEIDHFGEYLEVDPPRQLSFSWAVRDGSSQSQVTIHFVETTEGCDLILAHTLPSEWIEYAERTAESWAKMLTSLAENIK